MSATRLYRLWFDSRDRTQWFLGDPHDPAGRMVNPDSFTGGERVEVPDGLVVPVDNPGRPLDFSFGSLTMPVVTEPVGALLERIAPDDVQRIPVHVQGRTEPYEILNVVRIVDCIDRERTNGKLWTAEHGEPEEIGGYGMVFELRLDPNRIGGAQIFRLAERHVVMAVTEDVKLALEDAGVSGLTFKAISTVGSAST